MQFTKGDFEILQRNQVFYNLLTSVLKKKYTKHSSNTLLHLVYFFLERTLVVKTACQTSRMIRIVNFGHPFGIKFVFSKKATKIDKIFTLDLTLTTQCQIDGEDFINFCGLLRKHELYHAMKTVFVGCCKMLLWVVCQSRKKQAKEQD